MFTYPFTKVMIDESILGRFGQSLMVTCSRVYELELYSFSISIFLMRNLFPGKGSCKTTISYASL